jgi:hypothetical protein
MHLEHLRVDVSAGRIRLQAVCGPASSGDDTSCRPDEVIDSYVITRRS